MGHQYREAGEALDRYLNGGAPLPEVFLARGMIHDRFGEYESSVKAYNWALFLKPEDAEALTRRGWAYLRLQTPRLARVDFDAALKLRPAHAASLCGRGNAWALLGEVAKAVRDAEDALRVDALGEQEPLVACIYARAAVVLSLTPRKPGQPRAEAIYEERAVELVRKALRRLPEEKRAAYWRTRIQSEPGLAAIRRHPRVARLAPMGADRSPNVQSRP